MLVKVVGEPVPHAQSAPGKKNVLAMAIPATCNGLQLQHEVLRKLFGNSEGKVVRAGRGEMKASVRVIVHGRRVGDHEPVFSGNALAPRDGALLLAIVTQQDIGATEAEGATAGPTEGILDRARRIREAAALMALRDFHGDFELTVCTSGSV